MTFTARASLFTLLCLGFAQPAMGQPWPGSAHEAALAAHRDAAPFDFPPALRWSGRMGPPRVQRIVYGYYPYWVQEWDNLRWDLLTHIAFFAVEMQSNGTVGATHGWPDTDFSATAHANGVQVDVTFTLFSGPGIRTLCGSAANRARAIENMIDLMESGNADGINIDFEGVEAGSRDDFTAFITELRQSLSDRGHPNAGIGIAGPAVDWTNAFDFGALAEQIDVYFIMGYGYHWSRSGKAGPVGQFRITESWRPHASISMQRTLAHYTNLVPAELRNRIVFGVPYYGYEWPTATGELHASTTGDGSSRTYAVARRAISAGRARRYDADSQSPWYAFQSGGGWRQAWYDDEESLAAKYQLALEQDIGGIGMWALGYDEDYVELWDTLDAYFTSEPDVHAGSRFEPVPITSFPFRNENDTRLSPSSYFNAYGCDPSLPEYGREWVYLVSTCRAGTLRASVQDGSGVDVDLHLLDAPREDACLARNDTVIDRALEPGVYYLVADSFVSNHVPQEGAFQLDVSFEPTSPGCDPEEVCIEGRCVLRPLPSIPEEPLVPPVIGTVRPHDPGEPPKNPPPTIEDEGGCACRDHSGHRRPSSWLVGLLGALVLGRHLSRRAGRSRAA